MTQTKVLFSVVEDENLVEIVSIFSCAYDLASPLYKNQTVKDNAWKEIAECVQRSDLIQRYPEMHIVLNRSSLFTKMLMFHFVLLLRQLIVEADEIRWDLMHQNDYDVIPHRIEVKWYNKSYMRIYQFEFAKYNRTSLRSLKASGTLLKKLTRDLIIHIQVYKFYSNVYKYFPITFNFDVCMEFDRGFFMTKEAVSKYTNVTKCPPDPGTYYVNYLKIDFSKFPPFIPRGDFMAAANLSIRQDKLINLEVYAAVVNKPMKWK